MAIINSTSQGNTPVKDPMKESQTNQKILNGGPINIILGAVLVLVIGGGTLMFFQKGQVMANTNTLDTEIVALKAQVATFKDQKIEISKNASDALAEINKTELRWSEIIAEVSKLLPTDASGNRKINIISYYGSGDGKIALNMTTVPAGLAPYADVSRMIAAFNSSIFFKDAYVPSIAKGTNTDGNTTLSFVLNLSYQKPDTGSTDSVVPAVSTPRVPRPAVQPTN